ncbi:NAD-dependent epimerase/dehydratase family protein [Candidatus Omnitrophota bacterium]
MNKKRVYLLTGATGFIGSNLARRLVWRNEKVHLILREQADPRRVKELLNKVTCHRSDLSDSAVLKKICRDVKPDVIYHLAVYGAYPRQQDEDRMITTNILGTWNLLEAASQRGFELFVNTGSSSEYGIKDHAMKETDLPEPVTDYAVSKLTQTLLSSFAARQWKKPVVTLRPFSVYGPYEESGRLIPKLLSALYLGKKMELVRPDITHDYIYVDDVVEAFLLIERLKKFPGEVFNLGRGIKVSIQDVVDAAFKVSGKSMKLSWGRMEPRPGDSTSSWVADASKARRMLGWRAGIGLEKGLSLTLEWFKQKHSLV